MKRTKFKNNKNKKRIKTEDVISKDTELAAEDNLQKTACEEQKNKKISTVSIAVAGSILENTQSPELRTYLAGQIARAACIFQVDEIVIFDDFPDEVGDKKSVVVGSRPINRCCIQMGRILQYLECPQYLRKHFFPIHDDLKYCGILNPLNAPHHLSVKDDFEYREGVVTNKPVKKGKGSIINAGLPNDIFCDKLLTPGVRCTIRLLSTDPNEKKIKAEVVSPLTPRLNTGIYWGYSVRLAPSISKIFSECPYDDGYDLTIGTSDKGSSIDEINEFPQYNHLLIVFGGVNGLELGVENDPKLKISDPKLLFDYYVNTLPNQGSKTIRTEEAILISLAAIRPKLI